MQIHYYWKNLPFFLMEVLQAHLSFLRQYSSNYQIEQSKFKQIQIKKIGEKNNLKVYTSVLSIPVSKHNLILEQASRLSWHDLYSSQGYYYLIYRGVNTLYKHLLLGYKIVLFSIKDTAKLLNTHRLICVWRKSSRLPWKLTPLFIILNFHWTGCTDWEFEIMWKMRTT